MCGRAAQSRASVEIAASLLLSGLPAGSSTLSFEQSAGQSHGNNSVSGTGPGTATNSSNQHSSPTAPTTTRISNLPTTATSSLQTILHDDNLNMSPGMSAFVLQNHHHHHQQQDDCIDEERTAHVSTADTKKQPTPSSSFVCTEKVWGLVNRGGTSKSPLPTGMSKHFSTLMFNARSDTLYNKRSFRDLALQGKTCIVPVDGFYEWTVLSSKHVITGTNGRGVSSGGGKQPYYIYRSDGLPLFLAGLYTSVPTGRTISKTNLNSNKTNNGKEQLQDEKPEMLHTFTILTTDVCPELEWVHNRMPVIIWDIQDAIDWLTRPSSTLVRSMALKTSSGRNSCIHPTDITNGNYQSLSWHPVTRKMSKPSYTGRDCIDPVKLQQVPSVTSYFVRHDAPTAPSQSSQALKTTLSKPLPSPQQRLPPHMFTTVTKTPATKIPQQQQQHSFDSSPSWKRNMHEIIHIDDDGEEEEAKHSPLIQAIKKEYNNKSDTYQQKDKQKPQQSPLKRELITSFFTAPKDSDENVINPYKKTKR